MDASRLRLSVPSLRISDDGTTHCYGIAVVYGKLRWDIFHRFSEYLALYDKLLQYGLEAIPSPPAKSIGRPNNSSVLEERRAMLEIWIKSLLIRPDICTSVPFIEFIEYELHTGCSVSSVSPFLQAICQDGKFQLSDFHWSRTTRSIFASYEEAASIARLGKVWSLVESDELGSLSIWGLKKYITSCVGNTSSSTSSEPYFDQILHTNTNHRCRALYYNETTGRMFVGLETGAVEVYRYPSINHHHDPAISETFCGLEKEEQLNLHSESIMSIRGNDAGPGRILTVGFDKAIRVVNCTTLETLCGGKLTKRLSSGHHLTVGILEDATSTEQFMKSRMFIGTSNGDVFVFASMGNPPEWLFKIEGNSFHFPITALELAGSSLLVGQKYSLCIYRIGKSIDECKFTQIATYQPLLKAGRTIRSIAVARTAPLLFLGHTRAISVWDVRDGSCVCAFNAHINGVRRLCILEDADLITNTSSATTTTTTSFYGQSPIGMAPATTREMQLLSGGADGSLKLWRFPNVDELKIWKEPVEENRNSASTSDNEIQSKMTQGANGYQAGQPYNPNCHQSQSASECIVNCSNLTNIDLNSKIDETVDTIKQRRGGMARPPSKRISETAAVTASATAVDEDDSLYTNEGFTQVIPHRH